MDAVKFIKERDRMCRFYHHAGDCYQCPAKDCECSALEGMVDDDNIVTIVEEWSAAHPRKTRRLSPRVLDAGGGMMTELKPCPFCGYKGIMQRNGHCFRVYCPNKDCPIEPKTHWFLNHLLAIEAWNRRADNG